MINQWDLLLSEKRIKSAINSNHKPKKSLHFDKRTQFDGDLSRLIFSSHVRRMHDKTQVFPLLSDDNTHTRLTHSLEVAILGYSLGKDLLKNDKIKPIFKGSKLAKYIPIILTTTGLAHDIGNPPFGHYGERIIRDYFKEKLTKKKDGFKFCNKEIILNESQIGDFIYYNGNAQGFRTITKLSPLDDIFSLNLTVGTLASYLKYPINTTELNEINNNGINFRKKLGVYHTELDFLVAIRNEIGLKEFQMHPLALLCEAADTICYRSMDIEDGYNNNLYSIRNLVEWFNVEAKKCNYDMAIEQLNKFDDSISEIDKNLENYNTILMVKFRLFLINHFVKSAIDEFHTNIDSILKYQYYKELLSKCELAKLSEDFFYKKIIDKSHDINNSELTGKKVIVGLLDNLIDGLIGENYSKKFEMLISRSFKTAIYFDTGKGNINEIDDYYKLRLIVDYISGMTDNHALKVYRRLEGIRIE